MKRARTRFGGEAIARDRQKLAKRCLVGPQSPAALPTRGAEGRPVASRKRR